MAHGHHSTSHHRSHHATGSPKSVVTPPAAAVIGKHSLGNRRRIESAILSGVELHLVHRSVMPRSVPLPPSPALDVENTISPINCTPQLWPQRAPFLVPPYHGFVELYSYFDHDLPDFARDGLIVLANGVRAPSVPFNARFGMAPDFPAYWSDALRQYLYYDGHNGYDFGLVYQPVYAAAAGRVIFAGWNYPGQRVTGYGKMVLIDHGGGYVTLYGHLSRIRVHTGQRVRSGQEIATSGDTGHSTGPHLHFTVFHNCHPTDPYGWSGQGSDPLASYQGEASHYLWKQVPQILDPLGGWPGLAGIASPPGPQVVDLVIPRAGRLRALLGRLHAERVDLGRKLATAGIPATYDWTAAAFVISPPVAPGRLYRLPWVDTVTPSNYTDVYMAQASFQDRIARLMGPPSQGSVLRSGRWTAFLVHFKDRSYLLGTGPAHRVMQVYVTRSSNAQPMLAVTDHAGRFAVSVSTRIRRDSQIVILSGGKHFPLRHPPAERPAFGSGSAVRTTPSRPGPARSRRHGRSVESPAGAIYGVAGLLLILGGAVVFRRRRRVGGSLNQD